MPDEPATVGLVPEPRHERTHQQRLHHRHPMMRRHLERPQFQQPESPARRVRAVELVDAEFGAVGVAGDVGEQVSQRPIGDPRVRWGVDACSRLALGRQPVDLGERDFQFVQRRFAALVGARRLRGGADETPREQVRQRGMALPIRQHRHQQVRTAQHRRVGGGRAAEGDVVAAAGAAVAAVEVEALGTEFHVPGMLVERLEQVGLFGETGGRLDVDLDDAGVGGDGQRGQAGVAGRAVALDDHRRLRGRRGILEHPDHRQVLLQRRRRRQEHVQHITTYLRDERGARQELARVGALHDVPDGAAHIVGQIRPAHRRIGLEDGGGRSPGQRVERQAQTGRRCSRGQDDPAAAHRPLRRLPCRAVVGPVERQHIRRGYGDRFIEPGQQ